MIDQIGEQTQQSGSRNKTLSRRSFLKLAFATAGALLLGPAACNWLDGTSPSSEIQHVENSLIKLGSPERVNLGSLIHVPDIQTPIFSNSAGALCGFVTAGQSSYPVEVNKDSGQISLESEIPVVGPDNAPDRGWYRNGYTGISSVVQPNPTNPDFLLAALDCEQHTVDAAGNKRWWEFRGRIAYAVSNDGGKTWQDKGVIIEGHDPIEPGKPSPKANNEIRPTGAIHPWFIISEVNGQKFLYIYYTDLTSNINRPNQICLQRCLIDESGNLGTLELLTQDGFISNGEKSGLEPRGVFTIPEGGIYTAIPSVYKRQNGEWLGLFEAEHGFYLSTSSEGINWKNPEQIVNFPVGVNKTKAEGGKWFSNPTLFSPDQPNNSIIGNTGYMLISEGTAEDKLRGINNEPHKMKRLKFELKA